MFLAPSPVAPSAAERADSRGADTDTDADIHTDTAAAAPGTPHPPTSTGRGDLLLARYPCELIALLERALFEDAVDAREPARASAPPVQLPERIRAPARAVAPARTPAPTRQRAPARALALAPTRASVPAWAHDAARTQTPPRAQPAPTATAPEGRPLARFRELDAPHRRAWLHGTPAAAGAGAASGAQVGALLVRDGAQSLLLQAAGPMTEWVEALRGCGSGAGTSTGTSAVEPNASHDGALYTLTLCPLREPAEAAARELFARLLRPWWIGLGGELLGCFTGMQGNSSPSESGSGSGSQSISTSPAALAPSTSATPVLAWLARFADDAARARHAALLASCACLQHPDWLARLAAPPRTLRLARADSDTESKTDDYSDRTPY